MAIVATPRETSLDSAMGLIRSRFGSAALQRASTPAPGLTGTDSLPEAFSTGIPAVDALVGVGGLPSGRLSVLLGPCGSGKTMLAYHFLAALSGQAAVVLWVDLARQADPWLMGRLGVNLDRLLLLRPPVGEDNLSTSLEAALSLVRAGIGGLVIDLPPQASHRGCWDPMAANLTAACARASIPFMAVGEAVGDPLRYAASVVVRMQRTERLWCHGDVIGVQVAATVEKNKVGMPGRAAVVQLAYPLGGFFVPGTGVAGAGAAYL
ncbi:MAG: recombinase RecA [Candidatus Dormibacteria bacterium]